MPRRKGDNERPGLRTVQAPSLASIAVLRYLRYVDNGWDVDSGSPSPRELCRRFGVDWTPGEDDRGTAREILAEKKADDFAAVEARRVLDRPRHGPGDAA